MNSSKTLNLSLLLACILVLSASLLWGSSAISSVEVFKALIGQGGDTEQVIVWQIRLPRMLAALLTGLALGASGAALQGLLRNPLAEPGVLGVSACASLGATLALFFGALNVYAYAIPSAAVVAALAATALLAFAAERVRSMITLILIGVGLSSFAAALMALLMNLSPNPFTLADLVNWMLGSVSNRSLRDIAFALPFLIAGFGFLLAARNNLSALTLGEEAAQGIGLNLKHTRLLVILGTGLCTGAAVSLAGAIGFVGIVAPHLVRPWVAYQPSRVMVPAALLAALLLMLADLLVRAIPSSTELKLGVVAALLGAPVFIWIAAQRRLGHD